MELSGETTQINRELKVLLNSFLLVYSDLTDAPYILLSCLPATNSTILGNILQNLFPRLGIEADREKLTRFLTHPTLSSLQVLGTTISEELGAERASPTHFAMPFLHRTAALPWYFASCSIEGVLDSYQVEFTTAQNAKGSKSKRTKDLAAAQSESSRPAKANPKSSNDAHSKSKASQRKLNVPEAHEGEAGRFRKQVPSLTKSRVKFTQLMQEEPAGVPSIRMMIRVEPYHQLAEGNTPIILGWLLGFHDATDTRADNILRAIRGFHHIIDSTSIQELLWCYQHMNIPRETRLIDIHRIIKRLLVIEWVHTINPVKPDTRAVSIRVSLQGPTLLMAVIDLFMNMVMKRLAPAHADLHTGNLVGTTTELMGLQFYFQRVDPKGSVTLGQLIKQKARTEIAAKYKPQLRIKFYERSARLPSEVGILALITKICTLEPTMINNIVIFGCLDVKITADLSTHNYLQGYFIEFRSAIAKSVATAIFYSAAFSEFSAMFQITGASSEKKLSGLLSVLPDVAPEITAARNTQDNEDSGFELKRSFEELEFMPISISMHTIKIPSQQVQLWEECDFNGWCLLALACIIRGLASPSDVYSPQLLYEGMQNIITQYDFLIITPGTEAMMIRTKQTLIKIKRSMEESYRRERKHSWPSTPSNDDGKITLPIFSSLVQGRILGFFGDTEIGTKKNDFVYQYYSLNGATATIKDILNPHWHRINGTIPLPILYQINHHFSLASPRHTNSNANISQLIIEHGERSIIAQSWPDMNACFGMIPWGYRNANRAEPLDLTQSDMNSEAEDVLSDEDNIFRPTTYLNRPEHIRNILTLNGPTNRAQRILEEAPYPHPEFHYSEVPVKIAELRNLGHDFSCIVKELQRIPHSASQPVKDDPNRRMVEVGECVNIGIKLARLPALANFLVEAREHLIDQQIINPAARWKITVILPSKSGGLAELQTPHTDEAWELLQSKEEYDTCKRFYSRNDSIIIALGNADEMSTRDTLLDFAKGLVKTLHGTPIEERGQVKVQKTARLHLCPGQAAIFSSAAIHMGPAEIQDSSYRVFIHSISPNWPSKYIPKNNRPLRPFILAFDPYLLPPEEHWFLAANGNKITIPHSLWTELWVQFIPRKNYDDAFRSGITIDEHRQRLSILLEDPNIQVNRNWGIHPMGPINSYVPYHPHDGIDIDPMDLLSVRFGSLNTGPLDNGTLISLTHEDKICPLQIDMEPRQDGSKCDSTELDNDDYSEIEPVAHTASTHDNNCDKKGKIETSEDIIIELLASPESGGTTEKRSRKRKRNGKNDKRRARAVMYAKTLYDQYSIKHKELIERTRRNRKLCIGNTSLGKVTMTGPTTTFKPETIIWYLPRDITGGVYLGFSHYDKPQEQLFLGIRHYKYEYGLLSYAEREKMIFRPSHREPSQHLCATGDPKRANVLIDVTSDPIGIRATTWIPINTPLVYYDPSMAPEFLGVAKYLYREEFDEWRANIPGIPRPIRGKLTVDYLPSLWNVHIDNVMKLNPSTVEELEILLQQYQGKFTDITISGDPANFSDMALDGLNMLRYYHAYIISKDPPLTVHNNVSYRLPIGRSQLIRALSFFGQKYYFTNKPLTSSDYTEELMFKCSEMSKSLRRNPEEYVVNPFTHKDIIILLKSSHRPALIELFEMKESERCYCFHHTYSSKLSSIPSIDWINFDNWMGRTESVNRILILYDRDRNAYWVDMMYWTQLRMYTLNWFYTLILDRLRLNRTFLGQLFARRRTAEEIIMELKNGKGFPSNITGDGPIPNNNNLRYIDTETGCVLSIPEQSEDMLWAFLHSNQYDLTEHTFIEWILSEGINQFSFTFFIPALNHIWREYYETPPDGLCGLWTLLRAIYVYHTASEPPFTLDGSADGGRALNYLMHRIIKVINAQKGDTLEPKWLQLSKKIFFIWSRFATRRIETSNVLLNEALNDTDLASLNFEELLTQNNPEYLELEELEMLLQIMMIRYIVWVQPVYEDEHSELLAIGSYHPFGTQIPGKIQITLAPGSLRCLIQSLLNQDNINIAYYNQHFFVLKNNHLILQGLLNTCVNFLQYSISKYRPRGDDSTSPLPQLTIESTVQSNHFSCMYLKHLMLGGHPKIIPGESRTINNERGLFKLAKFATKINAPLARYSPRRLSTQEVLALRLTTDLTASAYTVTHPDDDLYVVDGQPFIKLGFLGPLTNDMLGRDHRSYQVAVRFCVHPKEGLQTWLSSSKALNNKSSMELSYDYGRPYWLDRANSAPLKLKHEIYNKFGSSDISISPPPDYNFPTIEQVLSTSPSTHFLDIPSNYTSHNHTHWNYLGNHNTQHNATLVTKTIRNNGINDPNWEEDMVASQSYSDQAKANLAHQRDTNMHVIPLISEHYGADNETKGGNSQEQTSYLEVRNRELIGSSTRARSHSSATSKVGKHPDARPSRKDSHFSDNIAQLCREFPKSVTTNWIFDEQYIERGLLPHSMLSSEERQMLNARIQGRILPLLGLGNPTGLTYEHKGRDEIDREVLEWYRRETHTPKLQIVQRNKNKHMFLSLARDASFKANSTILIPCGYKTNKRLGSHIHQTADAFIDTKKLLFDTGLTSTNMMSLRHNPVNYVRVYNPKYPDYSANARWDTTALGFPKLVAIHDIPYKDNTCIIVEAQGQYKAPTNLLFTPCSKGRSPNNLTGNRNMQQNNMVNHDSSEFTSRFPINLQDITATLLEPSVNYKFERYPEYAGFGTLNINGKYNDSIMLNTIFKLMVDERLYGFALLDTRLPYALSRVHRQLISSSFGTETIIISFPGREPQETQNLSERDKLVGGITLLFLARTGIRIVNVAIDDFRLGIWVKVTIKIGTNRITWVPCYIPHHSSMGNISPNSGALYAKLHNHLSQIDIDQEEQENPMDWVFRKLATLLARVYGTPEDRAIVQGDLNLCYIPEDKSKHSLVDTFQNMGLNCFHRQLLNEYSISPLTYMQAAQDISDIDHCLTSASKHDIVAGGVGHHPSWNIIGMDHKPIWIGLRMGTQNFSPLTAALMKLPMVRLHSSPQKKEIYRTKAQSWFDQCVGNDNNLSRLFSFEPGVSPLQAEFQLEFLTYAVAQHFSSTYSKDDHRISKKRSQSLRESSDTTIINLMLAFYSEAYRILQDDCTNILDTRIQEDNLHDLAQCYANKIEKSARAHKMENGTRLNDKTGHPLIGFWTQATRHEAILALAADYVIVRRQSHQKYKQYKSFCINQHVMRREELAEQGKLKRVIQSFLGTGTDPWSFDVLELDLVDKEGSPILETRPQHIHATLSKQAEQMFANQLDSIPCKFNTSLNNDYDQWANVIEDPLALRQLLQVHAPEIPAETRNLVADSIVMKPQREEIKQELFQAFDKEFNFQFFKKLIDNRDSNSSPGLSGLTIGMLKYVPNALLHTMFKLMSLLWNAKRIPAHWKVKWLHCIPKKEETISNITMLRPLGMLEVLRKIWTLMIIKPIKKVVLKYKAIDSSQTAFLPNVGTDSELTVLTHIISEARQLELGIDMLSWDIAKAFDSVHRMIQFLAWIRMGVPQYVAELLIDLDINGTFILKSPFALDQVARMGNYPREQRSHEQSLLGFPVGRGYTQGDVLSTLGWIFLFDIVITAAKLTRPDLHLRLRGLGSTIYTAGIVGFADDFITISVPELTPLISTTTSAVYAVLGLKSKAEKFRAVTTVKSTARSIKVYNQNWQESIVLFKNEKHSIKVLGVLLNLELNWQDQFDDISSKLKQAIRLLKCKRGRLKTKIYILKCSIIPKLLYPAAKIGLSLKQMQALSRISDELYLHQHIEKTFPKFLLRSSFSPIRVPDLEKIILTHKIKTLLRVQNEATGSPGSLAATGIMVEGIRCITSDDPSITGGDLCTTDVSEWNYNPTDEEHTHTSQALLQYLQKHGIKMHIKGYPGALNPLPTIFANMGISLNEDARGILAAAEISYINELLERSSDDLTIRQWRPAQWITQVAKIFGYNHSNLEERITEYIVQMESLLPCAALPPCRLAQGQLLALTRNDGLVYFDCAGINSLTGRAEGTLFAANKTCSIQNIPHNTCLVCTEGSTRLGVTGNYTIALSTTKKLCRAGHSSRLHHKNQRCLVIQIITHSPDGHGL